MKNLTQDKKRGLRHLYAASTYSLRGLWMAFRREASFRHELFLGLIHVIGVIVVPMPIIWRFVLVAAWIVLLVVELLNSAIESVVDLISPNYHALAGIAKDYGSAAVFLAIFQLFGCWGAFVLERLL